MPISVQIRFGGGRRQRFQVQDEARAEALRELARLAVARNVPADLTAETLTKAATCKAKDLAEIRRMVDAYQPPAEPQPQKPKPTTFRAVAERWTSGELHRDFPDHVRQKRSASDDAWRLEKHVYPVVGSVPVAAFTLEHAERVMAALPSGFAPGSRRQIAQLLGRVLALSVYPLKLITHSPIPRGWLPKPGRRKAYAILYPDEDTRLLACTAVPLEYRVLYGFLHREGMRRSEALLLSWSDFDLERGVIRLDKNKTDAPRWWRLAPGVAVALKRWKEHRNARETELVWRVYGEHLAKATRAHLAKAGIARPELTEQTESRGRFTAHSFRRSFVTRCLANGATEDFVRTRTGHKSTELLRYRQNASALAELELGDVLPLDQAIPELAKGGTEGGTRSPPAETGGEGKSEVISTNCARKGSNLHALRRRNLKSQKAFTSDTSQHENGLSGPAEAAGNDAKGWHVPPSVPGSDGPNPLAEALRRAAEAGQWEIVAKLAALLDRGGG